MYVSSCTLGNCMTILYLPHEYWGCPDLSPSVNLFSYSNMSLSQMTEMSESLLTVFTWYIPTAHDFKLGRWWAENKWLHTGIAPEFRNLRNTIFSVFSKKMKFPFLLLTALTLGNHWENNIWFSQPNFDCLGHQDNHYNVINLLQTLWQIHVFNWPKRALKIKLR